MIDVPTAWENTFEKIIDNTQLKTHTKETTTNKKKNSRLPLI